MSQPEAAHGSDKGAAFVGLIGGALFIAVIVVVTVMYTNKKFEGHGEAQAQRAVVSEVVIG